MTYVLVIDQSTLDPKQWAFTLMRAEELPAGVDRPGAVNINSSWSACLYQLCRTLEAVEHSGLKRKRAERLPISGNG